MSERALLIVDGNSNWRETCTKHFLRKGYTVIPVHHPRQALAVSARRRVDIAVIAEDLPEIDGRRLASKLKRMVPGVKLLLRGLQAGYAEDVAAGDMAAGDVDLWLADDCSMQQLQAAVECAALEISKLQARAALAEPVGA